MTETDEEPLGLPILPGDDEGDYFVLLPGLDRSEMKKWQASWEEDFLMVEVYYGGFDDEGNLRATRYPIQWPEGWDESEEDVRFIPVNPTDVNFERFFEEEEAEKYQEFFAELEAKF